MVSSAPYFASPRTTFKPSDVEEPIDSWVDRPVAALLVRILAPLPISPNQVTLLSGLIGVGAGVAIATAPDHGSGRLFLGAGLLFLSIVFDCADGQLARLRGQSSMVGRMLDGTVDAVPSFAVFMGLAWFLYRSGYNPVLINVIGWGAGYSMKWRVHAYDHAKNVYLSNTMPSGAGGAALPTLEEIDREREALARRGDWMGALILRGFRAFTSSQRRGWQNTRIGLGLRGTRSEAERAAYRERFRSTMRLWSWNGLGTHLWLLLLTIFATAFFPSAAFWTWALFIGPLNAFTIYLRARERRVEEAVQTELHLRLERLSMRWSTRKRAPVGEGSFSGAKPPI